MYPTSPPHAKLLDMAKALTNTSDHETCLQIRLLIIFLFTLLVSSSLSSIICWYVTYDSSRGALEDLATQLQKEVVSAIENKLSGIMRPVEVFLKQGLEYCYDMNIDLTTYSGQQQVVPLVKAFLVKWGGGTRCCSGIFTNMEYFPPADPRNNEHDLYHPNPMLTVLIYYPGGIIRFFYPQNKSTPVSRMVVEQMLYNSSTRLLDRDQVPSTFGWRHWPKSNGFWYNHTRGLNGERNSVPMLPGDFGFSRVFSWGTNGPHSLKMHGMVPIFYKEQSGARPVPGTGVSSATAGSLRLVGTWVIGFKLTFFSPYLADLPAVKAKNGIVVYVERQTGIYIGSSISGAADLTPGNHKTVLARNHPNKLVRARAAAVEVCPGSAKLGMWEVTLEGQETFLYAYNFKQNDLDWVGILTFPKSAIMEQVMNKAASNLLIGVFSVGGMNIMLIVGVLSKLMQKLRILLVAKHQADADRIRAATGDQNTLKYPLVTLRADRFFVLGRLRYHEELRDACMLTYFDDITTLASKTIAFLSHQWLGWEEADPEDLHYQAMVNAVHQLLQHNNLQAKELHLWVDTFSIPQQSCVGVIQNAIDSLVMFSSLATFFVVIAPPAQHVNTAEVCNLDSYMKRCWCKAEQTSHILANGLTSYYIMDTFEGELRWAGSSNDMSSLDRQLLSVFDGNLTCCQRKHPGGIKCDRERLVDAMLGLVHTLAKEVESTSPGSERFKLYKFILAEQHRLFPAEVKVVMEDGEIVTRELFGGLLHVMSRMSRTGRLNNINTSMPAGIGAAGRKSTRDEMLLKGVISSLKDRLGELEQQEQQEQLECTTLVNRVNSDSPSM